jgi:hypothetical protein
LLPTGGYLTACKTQVRHFNADPSVFGLRKQRDFELLIKPLVQSALFHDRIPSFAAKTLPTVAFSSIDKQKVG